MAKKMVLATVLTVTATVTGAVAASADPGGNVARGETLFRECTMCHEIGRGASNRVGPQLNNLFGRKAAAVDNFHRYSASMRRAGADGLTWEFDTLDAYLENPKSLVSGTNMSYRGMKDAQDRADLMAYLRIFSASPQNIPESSPTARAREVDLPEEVLAIVGDKAYGEYLASECLTCHQRSGSDVGIPGIINWPDEDFVVAMHAYKRKIRPHPVMQMIAERLSNEEIAALAAYLRDLE